MPGIWGAVGCAPALCSNLQGKFEAPWDGCESANVAGGMLGGHAFPPYRSLHIQPDGVAVALDGQLSAYHGPDGRTSQPRGLWELDSGQLRLTAACKGTLALADANSGLWFLATDCSGIFPLFYLASDTGLVFCSRQRPIAEVFELPRDPLGLLEFLRYNCTFAGRTLFKNLRRLCPGQVLRYDSISKKLELRETSKAWSGEPGGKFPLDEAADRCWQALSSAVKNSMPSDLRHAVMISGGWDSRTLLAAAALHIPSAQLMGYSHGDVSSRELRIAGEVCRCLSVPFRTQPINDSTYDLDLLQRGVARTETAMYPHWHRAGSLLAELGFASVSAGVYGEVMGGHFGVARLLPKRKQALAVGKLILGISTRSRSGVGSVDRVASLLRVKQPGKNWYLSKDFWDSMENPIDALNADIETELRRLASRGVVDPNKLIEAFNSENRGAQFFSGQILSCRAHLNVVAPYGDHDVMLCASQVPIEVKIHNKLNRCILQRHARELLHFPMAATLVPASMPVLMQEASRLMRYVLTAVQMKAHYLSKGNIRAPRLGWVNPEFLRSGKSLHAVREGLRSPIWDRAAIADRVSRLAHRRRGEPSNYVHTVANQMMIIYTADSISR